VLSSRSQRGPGRPVPVVAIETCGPLGNLSGCSAVRAARGCLTLWHITPALLVLSLLAVGCSSNKGTKGVTIQVRVVEDGRPIKFLPDEQVSVGLSEQVPAGERGVGVNSYIKADGGPVSMSRPGGTGIPPGKYSLSLSSQIGYSGDNRFEKTFAGKPPLILDVGPDEGQTFTVDIAKWTVTKP
jgi:hypothetical protein